MRFDENSCKYCKYYQNYSQRVTSALGRIDTYSSFLIKHCLLTCFTRSSIQRIFRHVKTTQALSICRTRACLAGVMTFLRKGRYNDVEEQQSDNQLHSKQQQAHRCLQPYRLIKILRKIQNMGNLQNQQCKSKQDWRAINRVDRSSDSCLMGPSRLLFNKFLPKNLDISEDNTTLDDDQTLSPRAKGDRGEDERSSADSEDYETQQTISEQEAIKIKWNKFIKLKKKSYLQDYVIIGEIGRGGFGVVSKVQAKYTGVFRAAKKIKKSILAKEGQQKLFAQMAILMSLDHPNIARLFEVYDYKSSYVLIMELCQGGELFKKIITQTTSQQICVRVMSQLFNVLSYLHSKGIVHRDLKPQNMLFQQAFKSSNIKLIDFGIAIKKQTSSKLTNRIGTPYYIAPQVLCKSYDEKCDIWSAGVILYMMICFRPPFMGDNQNQVMESILKQQPSFNGIFFKKASPQCVDLLKKMLVKNPEKRISAIQALNHPWITKFEKKSDYNESAMGNISNFKFSNKLEAVVYTYIVSQILTSQQKQVMKQTFEQLDKNHDGVISTDQLRTALLLRKQFNESRVQFLMRIIDTNSSGQIDYTEFIVAALQPNKFNRFHFEQAFAYFDIDHSGVITYDQISSFLDDKQGSQDEIKKLFKQIDQNHDGQISKQEFLKVLCSKSKERIQKQRRSAKKNLKDSTKKQEKQS